MSGIQENAKNAPQQLSAVTISVRHRKKEILIIPGTQ